MSKIENRDFFARAAGAVAKDLLGKIICRKLENGAIKRLLITETEAYFKDETFCYGYSKNKSNEMFYSTGKWCAFASMLMISCGNCESPDNVLIRRVVNLDSFSEINGPCNVLSALETPNRYHAEPDDALYIADIGAEVEEITEELRVNIDSDRKLNFTIRKLGGLFKNAN